MGWRAYFWISFLTLAFPLKGISAYDIERLAQAGGQYVASSQSLWHLQNSECGYLVKGSYGLQPALNVIEIHFRAADKTDLLGYLGGSEWHIKNQNLYFSVYSAINAPEFRGLEKAERCKKIYDLYFQIFLQSKQNWEHAVRYFSR